MFWSEIGSGFEEPGGTPPPRIPRSTSRGTTCEQLMMDWFSTNFLRGLRISGGPNIASNCLICNFSF